MPFGYSKEIFKYPPVQYIPLKRFQEKTGSYSGSLENTYIYLYNHLEREKLNKKIKFLNIEENFSISKGQIAVLILNGRINLIQYRGYEVIMVGKRKPASFHIFKIVDDYFYKDKLVFIFYDGENNNRLDLKRYEP